MPQGSTFRGNASEDQLDIVAKVTEKNVNNLSDNTTFIGLKKIIELFLIVIIIRCMVAQVGRG